MQDSAGRRREIAVNMLGQGFMYLLMLQGLALGLSKTLRAGWWETYTQACRAALRLFPGVMCCTWPSWTSHELTALSFLIVGLCCAFAVLSLP